MRRFAFLALPCLALVLASAACRAGDDAIGHELRDRLSADRPPAELKGVRWKLVRRIYQARDYRPLWVSVERVPARTRDLVANLCHADREGLRPADYGLAGLRRALERVRATRRHPEADAFALLDLELTARFLDYGTDLLAGRLDPRAVDDGWYIRARRAGVDSTLAAAAEKDDFDDMVAPLRPAQPEYAELVRALGIYREIFEAGGWPEVPGGDRLHRGSRGPRVEALRRRLAATGDLSGGGDGAYDETVARAVARFQERHALPADGAVGPATLAALDVPVERRIRQIELNLERYRWLPPQFGDRYLLVNIPDYHLYAYDHGKPALAMRVVVGGEYANATPVFADSMTFLVFRPHWYVPRRIVLEEIAPRADDDDEYLAAAGLEVVDARHPSVVLDPHDIDWGDLDSTDLPFRVRQRGGDDNALGRVKFMFPNRYSIYLHDTPARDLFRRARRTLSHGCVRVEDPVGLADYVLGGQEGWNREQIERAMARPAAGADTAAAGGRTVTLEHPVPVYLVYLTAFVRDGVLNFREDPYGKDRAAAARLGPPTRQRDRTACEELAALLDF